MYHTIAWRRLIEKTYGYQAHYLVLRQHNNEIRGGLPLFAVKTRLTGSRLVSLPGAQSCSPLVADQHGYEALLKTALELKDALGIEAIELKTDERFRFHQRSCGTALDGFSHYLLDLDDDLETLEQSFHKNCVRRAIKKAQRAGLELVTSTSTNALRQFYPLFLQMRKRHGLLPQPYIFFKTMWRCLAPHNRIELLNARYEGEIVSSMIVLKYKDTVTYEYGASREGMKNLSPSPFLIWEAIKRAKAEGFRHFDFGRTDDDNESLVQFKERWATRREALPYYFIPELGAVAQLRQGELPKRMMAYTMQYSPAPLCRLMGRVLYRFLV